MSATVPNVLGRGRWLRWLLTAMAALLVTAFGAVSFLQARQVELLNATAHYQDDYLVWSLFQFELEHLKLRLALTEATASNSADAAEQVLQRYEIFVSRLELLEGEHAAKILRTKADSLAALQRARALVQWIDALPLDAELLLDKPEQVRNLLQRVELLAPAIRDLSLTASHHVAAQVTERNELVRTQSRLSLWLTLLQCALVLGFALIAIRQFRSLNRHGRAQQALAERLRETQQAAEAGSRAKSVFLANMSHELRTPMHGLLGMLGLLRETPLRPEQQAQVQAASDSAHHLLSLLNDILDLSKMEAGAITIQHEPLQLGRLMQELEELCWPQARPKGLTLQMHRDADVPTWVQGDPTRLRQILLNLLSNAIKFSERGCVDLHLRRQPGNDNGLLFEVSDTGIGMDAQTQAKLFQRFVQGDQTRSRRFGGTGLGLEISRNLARAMGGDISVHSEPGHGSVFTLELPLPACEAPTTAPLPGGLRRPARALRVLVSEDHPTNRSYLQAVLERLGHRSVFCENGLQALQQLQAQDFDLVLMDLHTPEMDGYEATQAMRALPGAKGRVPIIALSADAYAESRERALQAGMDDFLAKPIGIEALAARLEQFQPNVATPLPAPTPTPAAKQDFDEKVLHDLRRNLPPTHIPELYQSFVRELPGSLDRLRQALLGPDTGALHAEAHSLKGVSANLGLRAVADSARLLESLAKTGADIRSLQRSAQALLDALERSPGLCAEFGLL